MATGLADLYAFQRVQNSNCDPANVALVSAFYQVGASLPPFDPTVDSGQVEVHRQVQVTFAIDGAEATPAS